MMEEMDERVEACIGKWKGEAGEQISLSMARMWDVVVMIVGENRERILRGRRMREIGVYAREWNVGTVAAGGSDGMYRQGGEGEAEGRSGRCADVSVGRWDDRPMGKEGGTKQGQGCSSRGRK